jgi:hypothetical protein
MVRAGSPRLPHGGKFAAVASIDTTRCYKPHHIPSVSIKLNDVCR